MWMPTTTIQRLSDDGNCIFLGCQNPLACNFDPTANEDDGSCEFTSCIGCPNPSACNFDPTLTVIRSASCVFPERDIPATERASNDADVDGVCDEFEVAGCTDETAENFNETATDDDGSCTYSIAGCTNPLACNFNPDATTSDGSCDFDSCVGCTLGGAYIRSNVHYCR